MTRSEIVSAIRSVVNADPHVDDDIDPNVADAVDLAFIILADETRVWDNDDATMVWDLVVGARECAIEIDADSNVMDALDAAELIVRRECDRLDFIPVS